MTTINTNSARVNNNVIYTSWNRKPFVKQNCSFDNIMGRAKNAGYEIQCIFGCFQYHLVKETKVDDIPAHNILDTVIITIVPENEEEEFKKNNIYGVKEN